MAQKILKSSVWRDRDIRASARRIVVIGFEYKQVMDVKQRRVLVRRLNRDDDEIDQKSRESSMSPETLLNRFTYLCLLATPIHRSVRKRSTAQTHKIP
jgi:hypothetical protein